MSLHNLALMNVAAGGLGSIKLGGAATVNGVPYLTFAQSGAVDGETLHYSINDVNGSEVGTAPWTAATNTLGPRTVVNSTNGGSPINVSGTALVAISPLASDISSGTSFANPTANVGLTAINGVATTAMRSDGAPALDQSISPTWTGLHTFTNASGIIINVPGATQFQFYHKTDQTLHPTGTLRPTQANTAMTLDICPNGTPTEPIYAKYDICNGDVQTPGILLNCLRGAVTATDVNIGSTVAASGATPLPFNIKWNDNIALQFTSGLGTWSYVQAIPDGSQGAPSVNFANEPLTGFYRPSGGGVFGLALNGAVAGLRLANVTASSTSNTTELDLQSLTSTTMRAAGSIKANFTNVTDATRSGQMIFAVPNAGSITNYITLIPASTTFANQIISTITTGTAPFAVSSTTVVANLHAATADGAPPTGSAGGDLTGSYPNPTLAGVLTAGGPTGSATVAPIITYDAKGRLTAVTSATITPAIGSVTGLGTGVATALALNIGSAGAPVTFNGAGGTPSSMTATNLTGTASGLTAGTVTTNANLTGVITSSGNATSIASQTGTGTKFVVDTSPTFAGTVIHPDASTWSSTGILGLAGLVAGNASALSWFTAGTVTPTMQVLGTSANTALGFARWSTVNPARFFFGRSRGASVGTTTIVSGGDSLGEVIFQGDGGSSTFLNGAVIGAASDAAGTPSATSMPTLVYIKTVPNGSTGLTTRISFFSDGGIGMGTGTTSPGAGLFKTNSATNMIGSFVSYTNGAGVALGTLTNAPSAGNPTKWIAIDDNGTTRQIPAW